MRKRNLLTLAVTTAFAVAGAGSALAGEVKGPPGPDSVTPKEVNAKSICAFSGLNDYVEGEGPTDFHVQSYGQDVRTGLLDPTDRTTVERPGFLCNPNNLPLK